MDRMTFVAVAPKHMVTDIRETRSDSLPCGLSPTEGNR